MGFGLEFVGAEVENKEGILSEGRCTILEKVSLSLRNLASRGLTLIIDICI